MRYLNASQTVNEIAFSDSDLPITRVIKADGKSTSFDESTTADVDS